MKRFFQHVTMGTEEGDESENAKSPVHTYSFLARFSSARFLGYTVVYRGV